MKKEYLITFRHGDPLKITEALYAKLSEEDEAGLMFIDRVKTLKLSGRLIRTNDIVAIDEFHDYATENQFRLPEGVEVNHKGLELLRKAKSMILDRPKGEKFDVKKHLPPEWGLSDAIEKTYTQGDKSITLSAHEIEAIDNGLARIDWGEGAEQWAKPCLVYNPVRAQELKEESKKAYGREMYAKEAECALEQMILDAPT